ncbi:MAG TPA: hypothetical protein VNE39_23120 [Planctomycetota bacterium]|nr:hypothetical protein [Planctomycetota bacterium]
MRSLRRVLQILASVALVWPGTALASEHGEEEYLIVPKGYTPERAWPLVIVAQNQVSGKAMESVPYFAAYCGSEGCRAPLTETARKYNIDPFRIYATGFSRSGHGLLEWTWVHPDWFAAIAPVCEDMREKAQYKRQKIELLKYIQQTPTYLWHGDHDSFLATGRKNYELMKAAGCPVQFGTYSGGHGPDPLYFNDIRKLTDFFDQHVLNPYPKDITKVIDRNTGTRAFWVDAKVGKITPDADYPVFRVKAKDGNVIEVEANEGVKKLGLYLTDKVVDMAKSVTVTYKGKEVFKGQPQPRLTVTLNEGEISAVPPAGERPLWEELEEIRTQPNETGAFDWLYLDLHTAFDDPRLGRAIPRRVSLDLGFRAADAPKTARIVPSSKRFEALAVADPKAAVRFDVAALERKLPVEVATDARCFGLAGSVDEPGGANLAKLVPAAEGKSGQVVLVRVRLANKGQRDVAALARLERSPFMSYPVGIWPQGAEKGEFAKGIFEVAGTHGVSWQYFNIHGNEPYQVLGFLMLDPGALAKVTPVCHAAYRSPLWAVQRELTLKAGAALELPLLLISVPSSDPKSDKPKVPDLAGIIERIKPDLLKAMRET